MSKMTQKEIVAKVKEIVELDITTRKAHDAIKELIAPEMTSEQMFDKRAFVARMDKLEASGDHEHLQGLMRLFDRISEFMGRWGGRTTVNHLRAVMPWLLSNPEVPHKDLQERHIRRCRDEAFRRYRKIVDDKRMDLDDLDGLE